MRKLTILLALCIIASGCSPKSKLVSPEATPPAYKADGDGIIVRGGKLVPMIGPLTPGQSRPMIRVGDPDADEVLKGDPDGTGNEATKGDPTNDD